MYILMIDNIIADDLARQMGTQKWGICRTSSITEVVMQMKYTMGKEKNATVKTVSPSTANAAATVYIYT